MNTPDNFYVIYVTIKLISKGVLRDTKFHRKVGYGWFYFELYFEKHMQDIWLSTQYQEHLRILNISINFKGIKRIKLINKSKSTIYKMKITPVSYWQTLSRGPKSKSKSGLTTGFSLKSDFPTSQPPTQPASQPPTRESFKEAR